MLLGGSRVNSNGVVEVLLGGAHGDGDGDSLHHLVDGLADAVAANHLQVLVVQAVVLTSLLAHQLEQALLLVLLQAW